MSRQTSSGVLGQIPSGFTKELITVLAARPDVLPLVVEYNPECPWGHYIEFEGTREQLIAAGVGSVEMFNGLSQAEIHSGPDEFGCKYTLERYGAGRYRLMRFLMDRPCYGDPADRRADWPTSLRETEPAIRRFVEQLLERISAEHTRG